MRTRILAVAAALLVLGVTPARADWIRDSVSIAWRQNGQVLWRFSYDPKLGKPFFHPVAVASGTSLTNFKPDDHPWHYALWFSWKYINHVNYWEEDRTSGQAAGSTRWSTPEIDARADGSATIRMNVTYSQQSGAVEMTEQRVLAVTAPSADGAFSIDWDLRFTAGKDGAMLDRTPMPGEPKGVVNGGYAGLSMRLAAAPLMMSVVTSKGPVTDYATNRARPDAPAIAGNFTENGKEIGGIAILTDPANLRADAPWYVINVPTDFRFICSAILAPSPRAMAAGEQWALRYRVSIKSGSWSASDLEAARSTWLGAR